LKSIDGGNCEVSTLKLYIEKVCPQIRLQYDKNVFLNELIADLYYKCEDVMVDKQNTIAKIQKNVEHLGEVAELYEALGSDADKDPEAFVDNEGNPMKVKKKKTKMCEHIQQKKLYADEGVTMKGKDSYYVKRVGEKHFSVDKTHGTKICQACPKGSHCPHAHNAIQLDLIPLASNIKNLTGIMKSQTAKLKNNKPVEPWRPCLSFNPALGKLIFIY